MSGSTPAREAAGEHADARALGQVQELLAEQLELLLGDRRAALVDLGVHAGGRVEHRHVRARLLADAHEGVEDRLVVQRLDDPRARWRRRSRPVAITGWPRRLIARAMLTPLPPGIVVWSTVRCRRPGVKFGHLERLVERGVERDGDDHRSAPDRPSCQPSRCDGAVATTARPRHRAAARASQA